jgi:hypothetical protein
MKPLLSALVPAAALAACSPQTTVSSVDPSEADCTVDVTVRVRGTDFGPAVRVDLATGTVSRLRLIVDTTELADVRVLSDLAAEGLLPGGTVGPGLYDVIVETTAGTRLTLSGVFRCTGGSPDAGDDGAGDAPDVPDDADDGGPTTGVVNVSDRASSAVGSAASVAWVEDRWVVAYVDDETTAGVMRLAEIPPGATAPSAVHDLAYGTNPADPLVRAGDGTVWLSWVDRAGAPNRFRYLLLEPDLTPRTAADLGANPDVLWRRDHDAVAAGDRFGFVAPADTRLRLTVVAADGTAAPAVSVNDTEPPIEPRLAFAGGAFRIVWWDGSADATRSRGAAVAPDGAVVVAPLVLPLAGIHASPVVWPETRGGAERLRVCLNAWEASSSRGGRLLELGLDFEALSAPVPLSVRTERDLRCALRTGLAAWAFVESSALLSASRIAPDGALASAGPIPASSVRGMPGPDIAEGPDGWGVVWLENLGTGVPSGVRFLEVPAVP